MEQFTLLLEQATNQPPSAGIIRAPPVWFHDCSATEIAGPGGRHSERQRAAVPRFQARLPKKRLPPEGPRVFRGNGALGMAGAAPGRAGHHLQCPERRAWLRLAQGAQRVRALRARQPPPAPQDAGSRRSRRALRDAPVFPLPSASSPGNTPCCCDIKSTFRSQGAVTFVHWLLLLWDELRGQWWERRE